MGGAHSDENSCRWAPRRKRLRTASKTGRQVHFRNNEAVLDSVTRLQNGAPMQDILQMALDAKV